MSVPGGNFPIDRPSAKGNEDAADSFSFTMEMNSPYYDSLLQFKTLVRVVYDDETIFSGRVLSISTSTVFHSKSVTCSGVFEFLNDTYYEGKRDKDIQKIPIAGFGLLPYSTEKEYAVDDCCEHDGHFYKCKDKVPKGSEWSDGSWAEVTPYLEKIIANHNSAAPDKQISLGNTNVTLSQRAEKREPSSWTQTSSLLKTLTDENGGHMKMRYAGSTAYLDWYKYYAHDGGEGVRPRVEVGKNIIDMSSDSNINDIFTRIIPTGGTNSTSGIPTYIDGYQYKDKNGQTHTFSGKVLPVSIVNDLYSDAELTDDFHSADEYRNAESNFGVIYKPVSFPDAKNKKQLWEEAIKWIKECYFGYSNSFSVKAIDMHILDGGAPKIILGECVDVRFPIVTISGKQWLTKKLVCKSINYDLFNPDENTYTFAIPSDLLDRNKQKKSSKGTASAAGAKTPSGVPVDDPPDISWESIAHTIAEQDEETGWGGTDAYYSFLDHGETSGEGYFYDSAEIGTDQTWRDIEDKWFVGKIVGWFEYTLGSTYIKRYVAVADRGIFCYIPLMDQDAFPVTHWYKQSSAGNPISYTGKTPTLSTFDTIANYIRSESDLTYGGDDNANQFLQNGRKNGTGKFFDPELTQNPNANPQYIFNAEIVGMFTNNASTQLWIAISSEYGIFAFEDWKGNPDPVRHWYYRAKGLTYDNVGFMLFEENGSPTRKVITCTKTDAQGNQTGHGKTATDIGSLYTIAVGGKTYTWELNAIRDEAKLIMLFSPTQTVTTAQLPAAGTLIWSGGGSTHTNIPYTCAQDYGGEYTIPTVKEGKTITTPNGHDKGNADIGSTYADSAGNRWTLEKVISPSALVITLLSGDISTFPVPSSGTAQLTWVNGGQHHNAIVYGNAESYAGTYSSFSFMPTILTSDGSTGEMVMGYDTTREGDKWRIKLNVPIAYTDSDNKTHIADGFVSASDFHLNEIPSFKTKIGIMDIVIAGKVTASEIEAEIAYIRNLASDNVIANTSVRAASIYAHEMYVRSNEPGGWGSVDTCFNAFDVSENNGTIKLTFYRVDKSHSPVERSFNIADTQFYLDAVSGAHNAGGSTAFVPVRYVTINPGEYYETYVKYVNSNGVETTSTSDPDHNRYNAIRVTANTGGGSSASNISLSGFAYSPEEQEPSGTLLTTLPQMLSAAGRGDWIRFRATITGGTGEKWYKFQKP